ncbi:uncharacterized protein TEOVI_000352000 [Trypanosoma equiperdum]|uniref:Uncharacterized protein n=2 Tax=Trypanozoon TaxID=39700 RepID=Q57WR0_TRYB2|nr:hypothetical protein, conserved [Trypanosoma brucei brucei TREU927]AAX69932.1 hypothetical protein, conserved [Trypanosoma brucei]AAZ12205.1 hypothetical protein, conserved [Trypanosoma brucei brucei TREU927]SCU71938.1 hypothetical protein, conserved [Trypanosoma equiperdum]
MNNANDTLDYSGNTSSTYSAAVNEEFLTPTRRTHVSVSTSHVSSSEADFVTGSMVDDEEYYNEYTSGYESRVYTHASFTYDEFSSGSPNSDDLSSTFMSYYIDSVIGQKTRYFFSVLRKPIVFFSLILPGSNFVGSLGRLVYAVTVSASRRTAVNYSMGVETLCVLPKGYGHMPEHLQRARLALPSFVEYFAKMLLRLSGVPSLADLQKRKWLETVRILKSATGEIISQSAHRSSGPMIPLAVFLPVFSLSVITIARGVISRQQTYNEYEEDEDVAYEAAHSGSYKGVAASRGLDALQLSGLDDSFPNLGSEKSNEVNYSGVETPKGSPPAPELFPSPKPQGERHAPSETQTNPQTVPTSRDLSPDSSAVGDEFKLIMSPTSEDPGRAPSAASREAVRHPKQYDLRGDVVIALTGEPSPQEVDVLLMAAAKYKCRRVILPSLVADTALASVHPLVDVVKVSDVMEHVMSVEESEGRTTVGVFLRPVTDETEELRLFTHPTSVVYIFVPAAFLEANVIAHLVDRSVYYSASLDEPFPINVCLYDRLTKERREGA